MSRMWVLRNDRQLTRHFGHGIIAIILENGQGDQIIILITRMRLPLSIMTSFFIFRTP